MWFISLCIQWCLLLKNALVAGKWLLYTTALWPWPSRSDTSFTGNITAVGHGIGIYVLLDLNIILRTEPTYGATEPMISPSEANGACVVSAC